MPLIARCAGSAYVHGLRHARGDLVALMDADLSHHVCFQPLDADLS